MRIPGSLLLIPSSCYKMLLGVAHSPLVPRELRINFFQSRGLAGCGKEHRSNVSDTREVWNCLAVAVFMSVLRWVTASDRMSPRSSFWKLNRVMAAGPSLEIKKMQFHVLYDSVGQENTF